MSENNSRGENKSLTPPDGEQYSVVLPCDPEQFGEFVSGLLGKPQTNEKSIHGVFEITRQDVVNTFHLVNQRIHQQNDAYLIQFTVRILYNDDSSVLLNTLEDFEHYTEIRPIASIGVVLSWTYLIQFKSKRVPEKQEINLSFQSGNAEDETLNDDDFFVVRGSNQWYDSANIFLRINHTERTWGVDIESLLTGHAKTLVKNPSGPEKFIYKNSAIIGLSIGTLFFFGAIMSVFLTSSRFIESYLAKVHTLAKDATNNTAILSSKLDFLIEIISTGAWPRFIFAVVVFLVISLILSVVLGIWVGVKANNRPTSYVLLSKAAEEQRIKHMNKLRRDWFMFSLSIATSIVTGIVSTIIFTKYFSGIG